MTQERHIAEKSLIYHEKIKYSVIFGIVNVNSPYLWHKQQGWGVRTVVEKLGIKHKERSLAVKRALTDFGAEESFGQAAKRFQEHYGWTVERGAIRREVEAIALNQRHLTTPVFKLATPPNLIQLCASSQ